VKGNRHEVLRVEMSLEVDRPKCEKLDVQPTQVRSVGRRLLAVLFLLLAMHDVSIHYCHVHDAQEHLLVVFAQRNTLLDTVALETELIVDVHAHMPRP